MAIDKPTPPRSGEFVARSLEETASVAGQLLPAMLRAQVVSLEGPLGAGKTHFVKAVVRALGITEEVTSPTFNLLQSYRSGNRILHHSDWYRLESAAEALSLGLDEYYDEGLTIIEWGDKFPEILPPGTFRIRIEPQADDSRVIRWD